MGLDQYASTHKKLDEDGWPADEGHSIMTWRKHANLQGWMERLWREKYSPPETMYFNCQRVRITIEDLDRLEAAVESDALPETVGFFFGRSEPEDAENDRLFIKRARGCIANGEFVFYDSWW